MSTKTAKTGAMCRVHASRQPCVSAFSALQAIRRWEKAARAQAQRRTVSQSIDKSAESREATSSMPGALTDNHTDTAVFVLDCLW
jgi:hypothetical protein